MRKPKLKPIPKHPNYSVTSSGKVWSHERECDNGKGGTYIRGGRWLRPSVKSTGYLAVGLSSGKFITKYGKVGITRTMYLHQLVAMAWMRMPRTGEEIDHKDGNRYNNHHSNLEWVSKRENARRYWKQKKLLTKRLK